MKAIEDVRNTVRLVRGVVSGFDGLQWQARPGEWEYPDSISGYTRTRSGEYKSFAARYDTPTYAEFVCVLWGNGARTPLPIILGEGGEYPVQRAAVACLHKLYRHLPAFAGAVEACARYRLDDAEALARSTTLPPPTGRDVRRR